MVKHDDVVKIQNEIWAAYKAFKDNGNTALYDKRIASLINDYERRKGGGSAESFCRALRYAWGDVIHDNAKFRHEDIANIQNSFWKLYTLLRRSKDMRRLNRDNELLLEYYVRKKDVAALDFCKRLCLAWSPVFNGLMEVHSNG